MPVTGSYDDGPEWGTQPYTNMFASDNGSVNPSYPVNTQIGDFLKAHGGTVLGSYGYSISPSSSRAAIGTAQSFEHAGGKVGVLDTTVPFGSVDFTVGRPGGQAEQHQRHGAGPRQRLQLRPGHRPRAGRGQAEGRAVRHRLRARRHRLPGVERPRRATTSCPCSGRSRCPTPAPSRCRRPWRSTPDFTSTQFPTFSQYEAWAGADLMIKGLLLDGPEPDPGRGHLEAARSHLLQRQRPPAGDARLLHQLREEPAPDLRVDHAGGEDRVQPGLPDADLRHRPARTPTRRPAPSGTRADGERERVAIAPPSSPDRHRPSAASIRLPYRHRRQRIRRPRTPSGYPGERGAPCEW